MLPKTGLIQSFVSPVNTVQQQQRIFTLSIVNVNGRNTAENYLRKGDSPYTSCTSGTLQRFDSETSMKYVYTPVHDFRQKEWCAVFMPWYPVTQIAGLKGQSHKSLSVGFFHQIAPPGPLRGVLGRFWFVPKIRGDTVLEKKSDQRCKVHRELVTQQCILHCRMATQQCKIHRVGLC